MRDTHPNSHQGPGLCSYFLLSILLPKPARTQPYSGPCGCLWL